MWKNIYEYAMIFDTRLLRALHSRNLQNMSKKSRGARMRLTGIHIKSFRAIRDVTIDSVENALILVGQNNTGKSTIIDALRVALGDIAITKKDFNWDGGNIEIALTLELTRMI